MIETTKKSLKVYLTLAGLICGFASAAQITGPSNPQLNQNYTYTFNNGYLILGGPKWEVTGGTVVSFITAPASGTRNYTAVIKFTSGGSQTITVRNGASNAVMATYNVTASNPVSTPTALQESNKTSSSFRANWNSASGASSYQLYVSEVSNFSSYLSGFNGKSVTGTSYTLTGLEAGKYYYYRLKAVGSGSTSGYSGTITANTTAPTPSASQESSRTTTSFRANWTAVSGAKEYWLDVSTSSSFSSYLVGYQNKSVKALTVPGGSPDDAPNWYHISGLTPGKYYYYRVRIKGEDITSGYSSTITANTSISAPSASEESNRTSTSFRANWGSVSGAASYRLFVSTSSSFSSYVSGYNNKAVSGTNHTVSGLLPGKNYYYRLKAVGANVTSGYSGTITANTSMPAPTAIQESNKTTNSFTARWNGVSGASSYRLFVSTTSNFSSYVSGYNNKSVSGTSASVTGLTPGTNYYYRVKAVGPNHTSGYSGTITANTTIPAPVASQEDSKTNSSFRAKWGAVLAASSYRIDVSTSSSFSSYVSGYQNKSVSGTSLVVSGLSPGKYYYYRVRAVSAAATSGNSSTITANTTISAPTANQESSRTSSSFVANWSLVLGASTYRLFVSEYSDFRNYVTGYNNKSVSGSSHSVTGLHPGKNYYYRLKAQGPNVTSGYSGTITANTSMPAPAAAQESNRTTSSFTANWNSVSGASSYRLFVSTASNFSSYVTGYNNKSVSGTSASVTGLSPGKYYYYRVRAVGPHHTSGYSGTITANTTISAPVASQEDSQTTSSFRANWGSVTGASSYRIDVSTSSSFSSYVSGYQNKSVSGTNLVVSGLAPGRYYYYRVRAVGPNVTSGNSSTITANTTISAPTANAASSQTSSSFIANWDLMLGASSFRLFVSEYSDFRSHVTGYNNMSVSGGSHTVTGLSPGRNYYYRLKAQGPNVTSGYSGTIATNTTMPAPVAIQESGNAPTSFTAQWNNLSGAVSYRLFVSRNSSFTDYVSGYNNKSVSGTSHAVTGLEQGRNYYYRLKAVGPHYTSGYSGVITANTTLQTPTASQESNRTTTSFQANWVAMTGAKEYRLDVSTVSNFSTYVTGYQDVSIMGLTPIGEPPVDAPGFRVVSGLTPGKNYYYRVRTKGVNGTSGNSATITANTSISAPTANQEDSRTTTSFRANWSSVSGAVSYQLDVSTNSSFSTFVTGYQDKNVTGTNLVVSGLNGGTNYYYRVRAKGAHVTSSNSGTITANTSMPAPTAAQESNKTTSSFTANWNSVSGASSYRLFVSETSNFSSYLTGYNNKSVSGTSASVTGLSPGKYYYYRVKAVGPVATSGYSGTITANTTISAPVASQEDSQTTSSFRAKWGSVSGASSYRIDVSTSSSFSSYVSGYQNKSVSGTNLVVSGLAPGRYYYYRVRAVGPNVTSGNSSSITANTTISAPTANAASSQTSSSFVANWDLMLGASSFRLFVSEYSDFRSHVTGYNNMSVSGGSHTVTGLSPGRNYYYRLKAQGPNVTSGYSGTIATNTTMPAPTAIQESGNAPTSFTAQWNNLSGAVSYRLFVSRNSSFTDYVSGYNNKSVSGTSHAVTGLEQGRNYYYRLKAVGPHYTSGYSGVITANTTLQTPTASQESNRTTTSFQANWVAMTGAKEYRLDVSTVSNFSTYVTGYQDVSIMGLTPIGEPLVDAPGFRVVSGLTPGKNYYYRVRTKGETGISGNSVTITANTSMPVPVAGEETGRGSTKFTANWNLVMGATSYKLYVSEASDFSSHVTGFDNLTVSGNSKEITGLDPGKYYYYRLKAVGADITSGYSAAITANTSMPAPTAIQASSQTPTSFSARWNSLTGAVSYRLFVSRNSSFTDYVSGYNNKSVTGSSHSIIGLEPGKSYYYRLKAVGPDITSIYSGTITTNTTVETPTSSEETNRTSTSFQANWVVIPGAKEYRLDVSAVSDFSTYVTGYQDVSVVGLTPIGQPPVDAPGFRVISGLTPGKNYYYRIRNKGESATSGNSATITANTSMPVPVAGEETGRGSTKFTANWNLVMGATSYKLYVSETSDFSSHVTGFDNLTVSGNSKEITGLDPGKYYYYRLKAVGADITSGYSASITANTSMPAPTAIQASSQTPTSFSARWNSLTGAVSYRLFVSRNSSFTDYVSGYNNKSVTGTSHTVTGLESGQHYYYRLKAVGPDITSGYSGFITTNTTVAAPTVSQESNRTTTTFRANWVAIAGIKEYRLDVSAVSDFSSYVPGYQDVSVMGLTPIGEPPVDAPNFRVVSGLSPGKNYYYRIRAVNEGITSPNSGVVEAHTSIDAPTILAASELTSYSFTANWEPVDGAQSYRIDVSTNPAFSSFVGTYHNLAVSGTSQSITGLAPGTTYYYRVMTIGEADNSAFSSTANTATHVFVPAPVALEHSGRAATSFVANWQEVTEAMHYRVDVSTSETFSNFLQGYQDQMVVFGIIGEPTPVTYLNVTGVGENETYYYRVRAVGQGMTSANSTTITVYPTLKPGTISYTGFVCAGSDPGQISGAVATGGDGAYIYRWQYWDGTAWVNLVLGSQFQSYDPDMTLNADTRFKRSVKSGDQDWVETDELTIEVPDAPGSIGTIIGDGAVFEGVMADGEVTIFGDDLTSFSHWERKVGAGEWEAITIPSIPGGPSIPGPHFSYFYNQRFYETTQYRAVFSIAECSGRVHSDPVTVEVLPYTPDHHSVTMINKDEKGQEIGKTASYFDHSGQLLQTQSWDREHNEIFASQPLRDQKGVEVGSTLSAPVGQTHLGFKQGFITRDGIPYDHTDFERAAVPNAVDTDIPNSLGWYYSANNPDRVAITKYPYSVVSFYGDGSGESKSSSLPGDFHYLESGNVGYGKNLPVIEFGKELPQYTAIRDLLIGEPNEPVNVLKQVAIDAQGNEFISYIDNEGNPIASARGGGSTSTTVNRPNDGRVEIHVPAGSAQTFSGYTITNLITDETVSGTSLTQGFYALEKSTGSLSYQLNYTDYAYNFYDNEGRLIASVTPKGVEDILQNGLPANKEGLTYTSLYTYDFQGRLTELSEPDAGTTSYTYRKDGQIRFSQNALQASFETTTRPRFSYTEYDALGRPIESGEFVESKDVPAPDKVRYGSAALNASLEAIGNDVGLLADTSRFHWFKTYYDVEMLPTSTAFLNEFDLKQTFVLGAVSSTESENVQSWYSYDDQGRVVWYLQYVKELDKYFLIEYTYDFLGKVMKVGFQPQTFGNEVSEAFWHHYTYDRSQRLKEVWTSVVPTDTVSQMYLHATYEYFKHGPLKRIVLAEDLQGIDYSYTAQGWLKAINHPVSAHDPGADGTTVATDAFGMALEYFNGDYADGVTSMTNTTLNASEFPDQFGGQIRSVVFPGAEDTPNSPANQKAYAYAYDPKYQLQKAKFGSAQNMAAADNAYDVTIRSEDPANGSYDANGNIQGIKRYGDQAATLLHDLEFDYYPGTNQLRSVTNYVDLMVYDEIGQLVEQHFPDGTKRFIDYDVSGKVLAVYSDTARTDTLIAFSYDDRGFRLMKRVSNEEEWYVRDASGQVMAIYRKTTEGADIAQKELPIYGAGKLGMAFKNPDHYKYIYEVTDHLGSVRALVTKLNLQATASMELSEEAYEQQYFDNLGTRHPRASMARSGQYSALTNASQAVGPTTTIRVRAGDVINLEAFAKYATDSSFNNVASVAVLSDFLTSQVNSVAVGVEGTGLANGVDNVLGGVLAAVTGTTDEPKAYLQYVLLNDDFVKIADDVVPVTGNVDPAENNFEPLTLTTTASEDGYLFAYVINESDLNVHFDDFTFSVLGPRTIRKTDFYPFGAVAKVWNNPDRSQQEPYRHGYQGQYAEQDSTTGWNSFELRQYDPVIGRWLQVDPEREFASSYVGMGNNPIRATDPTGGSTHTDRKGNVVAVYDDDNLGVYSHSNRQIANWKENGGTLSGGRFRGYTLHEGSFADFEHFKETGELRAASGARINYNSFWAKRTATKVIGEVESFGDYVANAGLNEKYDVKNSLSPEGIYYGSRLDYRNTFVSARDLGNYIAGAVGQKFGFEDEMLFRLFGGLELAKDFGFDGGVSSKIVGGLIFLWNHANRRLDRPYGENLLSWYGIQAGYYTHGQFHTN